jgi:TPR repeat protein
LWYKRAAEKGSAVAEYNLGVRYARGNSVQQSYEESFNWFQKAAQKDMIQAEINLAILYANGLGVSKNLFEAKRWLQKAADQGSSNAFKGLKLLERGSPLVCPSMPKVKVCGALGRYENRPSGGW